MCVCACCTTLTTASFVRSIATVVVTVTLPASWNAASVLAPEVGGHVALYGDKISGESEQNASHGNVR